MMEQEGDEFEAVSEELSFNLHALRLPECGNLRSTKRKDVKQRIKCIQALMSQVQKHIDFHTGF